MPCPDYTTEILGLKDIIILDVKQSDQRLDIYGSTPIIVMGWGRPDGVWQR